MQSIKLKSGHEIPVLGLGTWQLKGDKCREAVKKAIELGYKHIDTAWIYDNQEEVGKGIKDSKVEREKLFVTSKVWTEHLGYDDVLKQCNETLAQLDLNYLDLYLIHWPNKDINLSETLRAFKKLVQEDKVRSIGISNFNVARVKEAKEKSEIPISINQVEYHAYLNQENLLKTCKENNIALTAYSPLARGEVLEDPILIKISNEVDKKPGQVALRWLIQKGIIVIPKASSEEHIKENMEIFNFELSSRQMNDINNIQVKRRLVNPDFSEFED
ncbi:aldo/keto reductase [Candidatus Woesearchaeota archaeon]|nr:aldo/keto reductase [Candidatus Woesearchaeota archaeon]